VIVSSGTALGEGLPKEAREAFAKDYEGTFGALLEGSVSAKSKRERPEILEVMKSQFMVQSNFPKYVFDSAIADPNGVFNWNIKDLLGNLRRPTVIFAGEEDQATPVSANRFLADNIPGAKLNVIKDVGHFYQLEKPLEFNAALKEFIARLS
jgi:pimeloyl-ACP methyl ester carboxylesterase